MSEVDQIWRLAPSPALRVWRDPVRGPEPNPAALRWAASRRDPVDWLAWAERLRQGGLPPGVDLTPVTLADGWLLWWPVAGPVVQADDVLSLLQGYLPVGCSWRDVDSDEAHWDERAHAILGSEPGQGAPSRRQALALVHPDDRERLAARQSHRSEQPGPSGMQVRVCHPDGSVRHLKVLDTMLPPRQDGARRLLSLLLDETEAVNRQQVQDQVTERLEHALSLSGVAVWQLDLASQRIHFNAQGYQLLGLLPAAEGLPVGLVRRLIHPEDVAAEMAGVEAALQGAEGVDVLARYADGQGGWQSLLTRRVAERGADGQPVALLGIALNVSEQVRERERSKALLDRVRLATEAIGVGFWWRDLDRGTLEWDERMFSLHGRDPSLGPPGLDEYLDEHVHPADRPLMRARQVLHIAAWPECSELTFRVLLPSGRVRWIQSWTRRLWRDGRRMSFGMHVDVSEQREAQLRLEHERERDRYAIDAAGVGVWEWPLDGRPTYWNAGMYRLRGLDPADPRPLDELVSISTSPEDLARARAMRAHCVATGEVYRFEYEVSWPDGSRHWLLSVGRVQADPSGQDLSVAGVTVDTTERRLAEQWARERDRAEQASAAKSELLARVSHELRTPLNAVLGFADLMAADPLAPAQADRLRLIQSAGRHLLGVIDDVLTLANGQVRSGEGGDVVDLHHLAAEALQWVAPMAREAGVRLMPLVDAQASAWVLVQRRHLGQVLGNLLTNAIKYNRPGGRVWLTVSAAERDGVAGWLLAVGDEGRGISAEQRHRLFEPFNRLGAEREGIPGTGIGLSIVQHLVRDMGAQLQVHSEPGRGSQFEVWLPAADAPRDQPSRPPSTEPAPAAQCAPVLTPSPEPGPLAAAPIRVLYVEDHPVNEMVVRQMMTHRPEFELHTAPDGQSGIDLAQRVLPRIVLLDLHLPDMSGLQVLAELKAMPTLRGSCFVALSANALPAMIEQALAQGFDAYWTKPLDMGQFLADMTRIRQALG